MSNTPESQTPETPETPEMPEMTVESSLSKDGKTVYTRLVLPKDPDPKKVQIGDVKALRDYWESGMHGQQIELMIRTGLQEDQLD